MGIARSLSLSSQKYYILFSGLWCDPTISPGRLYLHSDTYSVLLRIRHHHKCHEPYSTPTEVNRNISTGSGLITWLSKCTHQITCTIFSKWNMSYFTSTKEVCTELYFVLARTLVDKEPNLWDSNWLLGNANVTFAGWAHSRDICRLASEERSHCFLIILKSLHKTLAEVRT